MEKEKAAERLFEGGKPAFLVTTGENGCPDARMISVVRHEGISTFWMLTGKCSDKFAQLSKDPRCMLYTTDQELNEGYMELRLRGSAELLDDPASIEFAWQEDYLMFFPGGKSDPNLVVVKFTADSGVLQTVSGKEPLAF